MRLETQSNSIVLIPGNENIIGSIYENWARMWSPWCSQVISFATAGK